MKLFVGLRSVMRELKRIADALEAYLRLEYDYNLTPPTADTKGEETTLEYMTSEEAARRELVAVARGLTQEQLVEEEEER